MIGLKLEYLIVNIDRMVNTTRDLLDFEKMAKKMREFGQMKTYHKIFNSYSQAAMSIANFTIDSGLVSLELQALLGLLGKFDTSNKVS
jgi:hypothetical protein